MALGISVYMDWTAKRFLEWWGIDMLVRNEQTTEIEPSLDALYNDLKQYQSYGFLHVEWLDQGGRAEDAWGLRESMAWSATKKIFLEFSNSILTS